MNIILRKEAKEKGLKHYFTGISCKHGHTDKRLTSSGTCVICNKIAGDTFRENNRDNFNSYQNRWYQNNKESAQLTRANYRQRNPEKIKDLRDKHNALFRESNPTYGSIWWAHNKDKSKEYRSREYTKQSRKKWNENNKGLKNYHTRKRQKQIIVATPSWADQEAIKRMYIRASLLQEQTDVAYHVDHIVPLHHPLMCGLHTEDNLQILSKADNLSKGNHFLVE